MLKGPLITSDERDIPPDAEKVDLSESALAELSKLKSPDDTPSAAPSFVWVYFPWRHKAFRIPEEMEYFRLRTARNRDLITKGEQERYRSLRLGIAGLSVGSNALLIIVGSGGPQFIKLADPDSIEITNLNRMRAGLPDVGENKAHAAAHAVWEIDPFARIEIAEGGLQRGAVDVFLDDIDVVIDEMDDIRLKFELRESARLRRMPVLMATDNGDGAIVDIERFDEEPDRPIFHGRVQRESIRDEDPFVTASSKIIDPALLSPRLARSLAEVGRSLSGIPQLATAASLSGGALAYALRAIANREPLPSGRYVISFGSSFSSALAR